MSVRKLSSLLPALLLATSALANNKDSPPTADPFIDPKDDPNNPLHYIASDVIAGIAFSFIILVAFIHSWSVWRWGGKWMLAMVIGEYTFALGIALRFGLHVHPDGKGIYIVEYLFVVLSPCAFIASDYVLLGRLSRYLGLDRYLLVPPRRITPLFIASDVTTFLIQATGGGVSLSATSNKGGNAGSNIFLAGLAAQLGSFFTFTCIYLVFLYRVRTHSPEVWTVDQNKPWYNDWRTLAYALCISCVGILIRSVYRVVELSQGYQGHLASVEGFFFGLDTLPLFIAIAIFVPFWPGRFIPADITPAISGVQEETSVGTVVEKREGAPNK